MLRKNSIRARTDCFLNLIMVEADLSSNENTTSWLVATKPWLVPISSPETLPQHPAILSAFSSLARLVQTNLTS